MAVDSGIEFRRLTEVPLSDVVALLNEPRNARHMPLNDTFDDRSAADWVLVAMALAFGELGLDDVVIALPFSRNPSRVVARFGFVPDGEVEYGGAGFRQYRLTGDGWAKVVGSLGRPAQPTGGAAEPHPTIDAFSGRSVDVT